jgi:chorismate synthase
MFKSGIFNGKSTGAPLMVQFENRDVDSSSYESTKTLPRPGHADWTAWQKFRGFNDYRGGGHFSGRITAGLVAAGVIAKKIIAPATVSASVLEIGGSRDYEPLIRDALAAGDSLGGVVECRVRQLPAGLGEPFFDPLESLISHIVFAIPAIKGIEFGAGFAAARMRGSEMNDNIIDQSGTTATNNAGGINGGISNGNEIVFRIAVKPASSIALRQQTIDLRTGQPAEIQVRGRHDAAIALRVPVVLEAATAIALADALLILKTVNP